MGGAPIELPVRVLDQPCFRLVSVCAFGLRTESVQRLQSAACRDSENCPILMIVTSAAREGCPIKASVTALDERRLRPSAVCAIGFRAKAVDRRQRATRRDFENGATRIVTGARGPAASRRPIQQTICSLDQPPNGPTPSAQLLREQKL